jgi:hypothetical protein
MSQSQGNTDVFQHSSSIRNQPGDSTQGMCDKEILF